MKEWKERNPPKKRRGRFHPTFSRMEFYEVKVGEGERKGEKGGKEAN